MPSLYVTKIILLCSVIRANRSKVCKVINKIVEKAGIDQKLGCHSFRRSRAEYILSKGLDIAYMSKLEVNTYPIPHF